MKSARICKITSTRKSTHRNIDDTDTEDDTENGKSAARPANAWMDEWKNYINTIEDVPDGMDLVRWWGVRILFHAHVSLLTLIYYRCMGIDTQRGVRSPVTTSR